MQKLKSPATVYEAEPQGLNKTTEEIITQTANVSEINTGECSLIGHERFLIPDGEYEAAYSHYETASVFTRKNKNTGEREGGKIYLIFDLDPLGNNHEIEKGTKLFIAYNASKVHYPTGKNGKFDMTRGKKFVKDYEKHFGKIKRRDRISPNAYKGKLVRVNVRRVKDHSYSLIEDVKEILVG